MAEVTPGVFYPSKAVRYFEGNGVPLGWEEFQAQTVTANESLPEGFFHIEFPHGIAVKDWKNGIATKRVEK